MYSVSGTLMQVPPIPVALRIASGLSGRGYSPRVCYYCLRRNAFAFTSRPFSSRRLLMRRTLRVILIVVAVLIVLVLVAPFLIPVNQFRPTIEEKASAALGRKVELGNLSLSLISGSIGADNLSIADDPKFGQTPFLTAKSVKVGVEIMPLIFSKALNVTDIVVDNPQVLLIRGAGGQWNYSSLGGSAAKSQAAKPAAAKPSEPPSSASPGEFSVGKLELKNGRITIGSTGSQKRSVYDNVGVTASNVSLTSKFL